VEDLDVLEGSPTVRRRRLGLVLRDLREARRITGEHAAREVERSASWLSRIETGRIGLRLRELHDLLDLYRVEDQQVRDELEVLAREGRQRGWWSKYGESLPQPYSIYVGFEAEASALWIYETMVVHGLLQTEDYARAMFQLGTESLDSQVVEDRVKVRMDRQAVLYRPDPLRLSVVLEEAVLHRSFGGRDVLRGQLECLVRVTERKNVEICVVPFGRGIPTAGAGPFTVVQFADSDPKIVYVEGLTGGTYEEGEHAELYVALFDHLRSVALSTTESTDMIKRVLERLR
jgi:transcriptional regulator with XRE-family HTH domain